MLADELSHAPVPPSKRRLDLQSKMRFVYSARNSQELAQRYDFWAPDYDQELEEVFGYAAPQKAAEMLAKHAPRDARILDAGAGTGLVGQALHRLGYPRLVGLDASQGMLSKAGEKDVYQTLCRMDLGDPLPFPDACFAAVISIGVFTYGHADASSFDELIRVTKPGGHIVFSLRPDFYEESGFEAKLSSLEATGKWECTEVSREFRCFLKDDSDVLIKLWVYKVR